MLSLNAPWLWVDVVSPFLGVPPSSYPLPLVAISWFKKHSLDTVALPFTSPPSSAACVHPTQCWVGAGPAGPALLQGQLAAQVQVYLTQVSTKTIVSLGRKKPKQRLFTFFPHVCFGTQAVGPASSEPSNLAVQHPVYPLPGVCASSRRFKDDLQDRYSSTGSCFLNLL